jgi:F420-dependent oxidoreductase-like protein
MELCVFTEPQQGATYDDLLAVARTTETLGFDGFFRSDHLQAIGTENGAVGVTDGLPGSTDAWLTLAALARETSRIRLGTLVSPATFRLPGHLAIQVAQADQMSGGRVELGLGAGWYAAEHQGYGIPFPGVVERFDRFEEQLEIITGLWATPPGDRFTFSGRYYSLDRSPALPKPVQSRIPVIVGGAGRRRTPELAARFATEFNAGFCSVADAVTHFDRVVESCRRIGRDPSSLARSWVGTTVVGTDQAEVDRRVRAIGGDLAALRRSGLVGTPAEVVERIAAFAGAGVGRLYLQIMDLADLDHLALIAGEVLPRVR